MQIIIAGLFTYFIVWFVIPKKTKEVEEATPYTFERDKPIENANETFNAWVELRRQIDIEKKEGRLS
ncbi:MAG: hypothetical protein RLZZ44_618 [Bacteroidota bacterium]|jgi:hypothetical protein